MRKRSIRRWLKERPSERCRSDRFAAVMISSILLVASAAANSDSPLTYTPEMAKRERLGPPVNSGPSNTFDAIWASGPPLIYPAEMAVAGRWGFVVAECDIDIGGNARRCAVLSSFGGPAFGQAAQAYLLSGHYLPAIDHGVTIPTTERFFIEFKLPGPERLDGPPFAYRSNGSFSYGGYVDISCRLDETGHPARCHAFVDEASTELEQAALNYVSAGRYRPVIRDGVAVSEDECLFHIPVPPPGPQ